MTNKPPNSRAVNDRRAPAVDSMPPDATGCWVVHTARTTHLFDLDHRTYARIPDAGRKAMPFDRQPLALCEVVKAPCVGEQFLVYVDALDAAGRVIDQMWRVSATITRVAEVDQDEAAELLQPS